MRRVFCKKYSDCLSNCVEQQSQDFDCTDCPNFERVNTSLQDVLGAFLLLARLYLPKAYKAYQDFVVHERGIKNPRDDEDS